MKTKQKYLDTSKKWKNNNKEKVKATSDAWREKNREKVIEYGVKHRDRVDFGGNRQIALERDNFECQDCGMTQEQHIIVFSRGLNVDHIDGQGRYSKVKNNDLSNLRTLCFRCHGKKDGGRSAKIAWGDLKEQDESEYRFPKIREWVDKRAKELGGIQKGKRAVAKEKGVSFWTIDTKYYERKIKNDDLGRQSE